MIQIGFSSAIEKFSEMTNYLNNKESFNLDLSSIENFINKDGKELLRRLLIGHLDERRYGDVGSCVIGADDVKRTHKRIRTKNIKTLFGEIEIKRIGYSNKNASSLFPLDGILNLPTTINVSYSLQRNLILEIIKSSFDEALESIERWTGVTITKEQAKKIVIESAIDFKEFYDNQKEKSIPNESPLLILTSDGKGVVMRHEDLREETKKRSEKKKDYEADYGKLLSKN